LRVAWAASVDPPVLDSDREFSLHRIDVPEDHDLRAPASGPGDRVARFVDVCSESEGLGELDEFPRRALLMTGWAVLFEEAPQDFELIHGGGPSQGRPGRRTTGLPESRGAAGVGSHSIRRRSRSRLRPATPAIPARPSRDRKSTRLNSSHVAISYAVFCLKKKNIK